MSETLYNIATNILECDWFDEETGEIDLEKKAEFEELKISFDTKAENVIKYIKNLQAEAEMIKKEEQSLKERRERKEKKAEALRNYLEDVMLLTGRDKVEYISGEAKFRKSKAVEVDDEFIEWAEKNADYLLSYKEPTANKTEIKKAIIDGVDVKFARIVENNKLKIN